MGLKSLFSRKKKQFSSTNSLNQTQVISSLKIDHELQQVFNKFDANGDGKICASELGSIMGILGQPATEEEVENMIKEVDADGDGFIELNTKGVDSEEFLENLKHAFDVFISAKKLHNVLMSLGEECSIEECEKMIRGVDFDKFKVMMTKGSHFGSN